MILFEGIAAVVAKIASASTIAQATAGLGIAVAGVTGAGAAGVLPGPIQDSVAGAIESVSSFDVPDSGDETLHSGVDGADDAPAADPTDIATPSSIPETVPTTIETTIPTGVEPGDDDGEHQNRGGTAASTAAVRTEHSGRDREGDDSPSVGGSPATPSAEVEEPDDDSAHGGDSGGRSAEDASRHGGSDDDSSGHGGGDD